MMREDPLSVVASEIEALLQDSVEERDAVSDRVSFLMDELEDEQARLKKVHDKVSRLSAQLELLKKAIP